MGKQYRVKCREIDNTGKGLVTFNQSAFAVPYLLDGETAKIELVYGKDRQSTTAKLAEIETASPDRRAPVCPAFSRCGGCQLQHMHYEKQLAIKQTMAERLLGDFTKQASSTGKSGMKQQSTSCAAVSPIIGAKNPYHYRHKIHATFLRTRQGMKLGIYEENTHRVIDVKDCAIQNKTANAILKTIRSLADRFRLTAYNEDTRQGLLRHVLIRCGYHTGQVMVVFVLGTTNFPGKAGFIEALRKAHPEITTIVQNINNKKTSMVLGEQETVLYGNGWIEDSLCGLTFRISPKSFYQVNPEQTELLYQTAMQFAGLTGNETILDTYCGTGTIGLIASRQSARVIGVESNAAAVRDAVANARANQIENAEFICEDAGAFMKKTTTTPDVVFMDPPRSGSDEAFLRALAELAPARIVYISCNMQTQARDLAYLTTHGYQVNKIQPVDLFPWTEHVETVALLSNERNQHYNISVKADVDASLQA